MEWFSLFVPRAMGGANHRSMASRPTAVANLREMACFPARIPAAACMPRALTRPRHRRRPPQRVAPLATQAAPRPWARSPTRAAPARAMGGYSSTPRWPSTATAPSWPRRTSRTSGVSVKDLTPVLRGKKSIQIDPSRCLLWGCQGGKGQTRKEREGEHKTNNLGALAESERGCAMHCSGGYALRRSNGDGSRVS